MKGNSNQKARKLAEEHWEWLESLLHKIFIDAFIHGYKHSQQEVKDEAVRTRISSRR